MSTRALVSKCPASSPATEAWVDYVTEAAPSSCSMPNIWFLNWTAAPGYHYGLAHLRFVPLRQLLSWNDPGLFYIVTLA